MHIVSDKHNTTYKWINSWLSGRTQQVVLDGQASDSVLVISMGVTLAPSSKKGPLWPYKIV